MYEEVVHIPLFLHDPRRPASAGVRRSALTQTIDLAPTFLDLFNVRTAAEMQGHSLLPLLDADRSPREGALFGYFGVRSTSRTDAIRIIVSRPTLAPRSFINTH